MNIKSLALASLLTVGALFGGNAPAEAKMSRCYLGHAGTQLNVEICDVERRVNANGHVVFDISGPVNGTVVLWNDGTGEWVTKDGVSNFVTEDLDNGYVRMINTYNNFNFVFTTR